MGTTYRGSRRAHRRRRTWWLALVFLGVTLFSYGGAASASAVPAADPATGPVGPLRAPGGPDLVDHDGRVVLLHGVDLVYKIPPYEVVSTAPAATC